MSNKPKFPVLPLRDVIVFPNMVIPLFVGRSKSIAALDAAMEDNKQIFLVAKKADNDNPLKRYIKMELYQPFCSFKNYLMAKFKSSS
ncbi:MAG: hypothetical protein CM15mP93_12310 [Thiotrichaceae bacterium]|nr:MAG: hypothetical protein CM15mP93_12310 [Thiotrichaceae bacterium]